MPVVRTNGRSRACSVYSHVITKFSRMGRLPHFLSYGAPPTRGASRCALSSANKTFTSIKFICFRSSFVSRIFFSDSAAHRYRPKCEIIFFYLLIYDSSQVHLFTELDCKRPLICSKLLLLVNLTKLRGGSFYFSRLVIQQMIEV